MPSTGVMPSTIDHQDHRIAERCRKKKGATVSKMEMVKPSRKEITAQFLTGVKHWAVTFSLGMGYKPKLEIASSIFRLAPFSV